ILETPSELIFLTAAGIPYVESSIYDSVTRTSTNRVLTRLQIGNYDGNTLVSSTYMAALKDAGYYTSDAPTRALKPMIFLYSTGQIQQFAYYRNESTYSGTNNRYETYSPYLVYESNSILETGVKAIDSCGTGMFIFKNDGTVRLSNCIWVQETATIEVNDRDRTITYMRPYLKNTTEMTPLNNIVETQTTKYRCYFMTDPSDNTYRLVTSTYCPVPVLGGDLTLLGKVKAIGQTEFNMDQYVEIVYDDGTVEEMKFYNNNTLVSDAKLPYNGVKDVISSRYRVFLLFDDGRVLGKGGSNRGQLGNVGYYYPSFADPLLSTLNYDKTKTLYSLMDIFNDIADSAFYGTGAYATALNDIYKRYSSNSSGSMYVLLGDGIKYETAYDDYEKDPEYSRKWIIAHDAYYFDNSMGLSTYHNPAGATINPPAKLDKVGKYTINLYARDNPKANNLFDNYRLWSLGNHNLTVYIHRKPIAMLKLGITKSNNGTYTVAASDAGSYDLDHNNSRTDKGIAAREWRWRESTSAIWTNTQMNKSDCDPEKSYIVQLRVKDLEGVWSDYDTVNIDRNNPPVALFSLDKTVIRDTEALKVKDQSFPQSFSTIDKWHWVVKKLNSDGSIPAAALQNAQFTNSNTGTGALAGYDANIKTSYIAYGPGTYRIYLRVRDSNGLWSDGGTGSTTPADLSKYYSMDFYVDKAPSPSFTVANNVIKTTDLLKITDTTTATGISPVTKWHWIVKKLNADGSVPGTNLQSGIFNDRNTGTGTMAGYDVNAKTDYSESGAGTYRIYLRAANGNGMWSDGGTDSIFTLSGFFYRDIVVDSPPTASFTIEKNPIDPNELLKLRDTSVKTGVSPITKWHWIVKKLNADGSEPVSSLQDEQLADSNKGAGALAGYDAGVKTDYSKEGPGAYRVYLRVCNGNGMWSDGGTDSAAKLDSCFHRDLLVQEAYKLANFRVVKVKDLHLSSFYFNPVTGQYDERPMGVNTMAVD
ncbi:MAG TPA: hypothetical protein VN549_05740, partial [Negativicutes bacterium]|nr:hypothetical protein [Negativicutes bacterium]